MKRINKRWIFVIIGVIICAVAFLWSTVLYKVFSASDIKSEITGTLLGTIISAIVTVLLLQGQTEIEEGKDISLNVFGKKQEVYHKFIETLEEITQDGKINIPSKDNPDKNDELQHLIYQLGFVQMHASKKLAEDVTKAVGDLLSTVSLMQNESSQKKNELYSELAGNVFNIVTLLRNDLYNSDFKAVSKVEFNSALRATGAFDDELLSEKGKVETLEKFMSLLKTQFEQKEKLQVALYYRKQKNNDINWISRNYLAFKTDRWAQILVSGEKGIFIAFIFDPEGYVSIHFYNDSEFKNENLGFLKKYNALQSKDTTINFININDNSYKTFARLSDSGKEAFVANYVKNILNKIDSISNETEA